MILACQNIQKSFGTDVILKNASFHIEDREKAAIVGINGAGKSTLLKIIVHQMDADGGEVILSKGKTLGYLAQHDAVSSENTIYEELLSVKQDILDMEKKIRSLEQEMKTLEGEALTAVLETYNRLNTEFEHRNGYACQSEVTGVLKGLGFQEDEFSKKVSTLSGGQKTRVALGKLLLTAPDIILLDEPTNHLDMQSIAWLENYLLNYPGAVLIVAHDRYFLNRVVTKIIEIDNGNVTTYLGNYSDYAAKRAQIRDAQLKAYLNQQQEIHHQEEVIAKLKSFNREKSIKRAESREKMLDKLDRIEKPSEVSADMHITLSPRTVSGNDVLTVEGLSKSFDGHTLFENLDFQVKRGERVAIIGNNGTGKTTILKIINGLLEPDAGDLRLRKQGSHRLLRPGTSRAPHGKNIYSRRFPDDYPNLSNTEIRSCLAAFLFTGDDVFKRISDLSGGERGRVSLAKLMLSEANFIILDEPTNHLDITSKEILEEALNNYTGTLLYVSHDRYFINQTATRILELTGNTLVNYVGNYDYYLEKKEALTAIYAPSSAAQPEAAPQTDTATKLDWKQQKEEQARIRKRQNDLKKTEERIAELEERDKTIDEALSKEEIFTQVSECMKLNTEKAAILEELEQLYEKWEELAED